MRSKFSLRSFATDCVTHNVTVVQYIGELARWAQALSPESLAANPHENKTNLAQP